MSEKYNGWANYPTWAVNLWLTNDQGLYYELLGIIREADDAYDAAAKLSTLIEETYHPYYGDHVELREPDVYADLLGWALDYVDWHEIITGMADDMEDAFGAEPEPDDVM